MAATRAPRAFAFRLSRRAMIGAATIACACCRLVTAVARRGAWPCCQGAPPATGLMKVRGAANWGELSPAFKVCQLGLEQSPIDLATAVAAELGGLDIAYRR